MSERYRLNIKSIQVTRAGEKKVYRRGELLDDVRPSILEQMVRVGQAVPDADYSEAPPELVKEPLQERSETQPESPLHWQTTLVANLELSDHVKTALANAGLNTVADILAFGEAHETLVKINGIGESSEKAVQAAIEKIAN